MNTRKFPEKHRMMKIIFILTLIDSEQIVKEIIVFVKGIKTYVSCIPETIPSWSSIQTLLSLMNELLDSIYNNENLKDLKKGERSQSHLNIRLQEKLATQN